MTRAGALAILAAAACGPTAPALDAAPPLDARVDGRPVDGGPLDAALDARAVDAATDARALDAAGSDGGSCPFTAFALDGALDPGVPVRAGGVTSVRLAAAVTAAGLLYVATDDAGEGSDHFVLVSATPPGAATRAAPFAKAGVVAAGAGPLVFLADENDNAFTGWFRREAAAGDTALTGAAYAAATGANGGVVEGTVDLAAAFGAVPAMVYLAAVPYATADGGALVAAAQTPVGDGDGDVDALEYLAVATACP